MENRIVNESRIMFLLTADKKKCFVLGGLNNVVGAADIVEASQIALEEAGVELAGGDMLLQRNYLIECFNEDAFQQTQATGVVYLMEMIDMPFCMEWDLSMERREKIVRLWQEQKERNLAGRARRLAERVEVVHA